MTDGSWFLDIEEAFLASTPARGVIADLGCGPGLDGARFAERGYSVVGMDLSAGMLSVAARALGGRLAQADLRSLPIRRSRLDGIWCSAALLHVPDSDTTQVLEGCRRALKPSGPLSLITALGVGARSEPVPYAPNESRWFVYRQADRLRQQLLEAGFDIRAEAEAARDRRWMAFLAWAV